ncbi:RadC family protein [Escherichia coli]|uniref:RadC family protein n=1 Tax=Escherichia coli TaxID=562 RepID=UPI003D1601FE
MSYGVLCHDGPLLPAAGLRPAASGMQRHYAHHRLNGEILNMAGLEREEFRVLYLNNQNQLIAGETLFTGTINRTEVHPREVIKRALYHNAAAVVLAHNHPSGEVTPSKADRLITERLVQALGLVDIRVPDHLIVGGSQVFSFAEHGLL